VLCCVVCRRMCVLLVLACDWWCWVGPPRQRSGDPKSVIGVSAERALCKLLRKLTPASVLPLLLTGVAHENWRVRKQSVQSVSYLLLVHPTYNFELQAVVRTLGAVLDDPRQRVRTAAGESLAVVHAVMERAAASAAKRSATGGSTAGGAGAGGGGGGAQLWAMLSMLHPTQLNAVQRRVAAGVLPTASEHALIPSNVRRVCLCLACLTCHL
jgi:hypothetical protein